MALVPICPLAAVPAFSDYIVFADESGDHGMVSIDRDYPVFVLAFCLFHKEEYITRAVPDVLRFKFNHFGHDQVILHELDIRRSRGPFTILQNAERRGPFYDDLNAVMAGAPMTIVASVIDKEKHRARYQAPVNPYHISMGFGLERLYREMEGRGCRGGTTHVLFERRGAKEDTEVEAEFRRICDGYNPLGRKLPFEIVMAGKACNSSGLQLADLIARPIGRKIIKPEQENRAFDILAAKFRRNPWNGSPRGWGLKVFPE
jgi:hypothetical protein